MENDAQNEDFTRELEVESNKKLFTLPIYMCVWVCIYIVMQI